MGNRVPNDGDAGDVVVFKLSSERRHAAGFGIDSTYTSTDLGDHYTVPIRYDGCNLFET